MSSNTEKDGIEKDVIEKEEFEEGGEFSDEEDEDTFVS